MGRHVDPWWSVYVMWPRSKTCLQAYYLKLGPAEWIFVRRRDRWERYFHWVGTRVTTWMDGDCFQPLAFLTEFGDPRSIPEFLEKKLRAEAAQHGFTGKRADRYVYGAMNNLGAMKGNQETPKGKRMAAKHRRDVKAGRAR